MYSTDSPCPSGILSSSTHRLYFCQEPVLKSPEHREWGRVRSRGELFYWPGSGCGAPVLEQAEGQTHPAPPPPFLLSPNTSREAGTFLVTLLTTQLKENEGGR